MDTSKINQKEIDYNLNLINSEVNIANGRLLLECPIMSVGSSSFQIDLALIYNSKYLPTDFNNIKIGIGNGWKFNIEEYVYKYEESFELENFTSNDYVYIDSSLKIHRFIKYKETSEGTFYYDESKASLKLLVNNDKKEIIDIANNRKLFNEKGNLYEVIDGQNEAIKKCLVYNNGLLKEIYDKRKQSRKIVFEYNNKKELVSITCNKKKIELIYEESRLSKVKKIVDKKSKYLYEFKYNEYLEYVIELESMLALKFSYLEGKVKEVIKGALKESLILTNGDNYVKEDQYVNDKLYLSSLNKDIYKKYYHIPKKYYHIPNEYIKSKTLFDYNYAYTDVTNEKNIVTRHYLNTNDFVTVSFERIQDNNKTLFKTSGFDLLRGGGGSEKINGKRSKVIGQDKIIHLDNVMEFSKKFEPYDNGSESKDKYTENYVLSFFIKGNIDISDFIEAKFNYIINNVKFTCNSTYLTKTKASAWQYVTMPVTFNDNKDKISDLYLEFKNVPSDVTLEIAEVKIKEGSNNVLYIDTLPLAQVKQFKYEINGVVHTVNKSSSFFMTENDVIETYKSLVFMRSEEENTYDLICCGGTKAINVNSVSCLSDEIEKQFIGDYTLCPNFYYKSSTRVKENKYIITKIKTNFLEDNGIKYYQNTISSQIVRSSYDDTNEKASKIVEEVYLDNRTKKTIDEYGVITKYFYDDFLNLEKIKTYNSKDNEYLETIYKYDSTIPSLKERVISVTENGITKNYTYDDDFYNLKSETIGDVTKEYQYDDFNERVVKVTNKDSANTLNFENNISYDKKGNVNGLSDDNITNGYIYNALNEPLKYYENKRLILEKQIIKENDYDTITEKLYNNNTSYISKTKIDKYGKVLEKENDNKKTVFKYQDGINECESLAQVSVISDPYTKQDYKFKYDSDNRPCSYETTGNEETGATKMLVRQIGDGVTQYKYNEDIIVSKMQKENTIYDDNPILINPRIKKTLYVSSDGLNSDKENQDYKQFSYSYEYDSLGRVKSENNIISDDYVKGINQISFKLSNLYTYQPNSMLIKTKDIISSITSTLSYDERYSFKYNPLYDKRGQVIKFSSDYLKINQNASGFTSSNISTNSQSYSYDAFGRVIKEDLVDESNETKLKEIEYKYSNSNNIKQVIKNNNIYKTFKYNNGRVEELKLYNDVYQISYDNYGNIIKDNNGDITYDSRNLLSKYRKNNNNYNNYNYYYEYYYDYQGARFRKKIVENDVNYVNYYLDGSKILGEDRLDETNNIISKTRYFYDAFGVCGLTYNGEKYSFIKDTLDNIRVIVHNGKPVGEYIYDAWGNESIIEYEGCSDNEKHVLYNNPFRWKSSYKDKETGLYYINNKYYSPILMMYLNQEGIESVSSNNLNRHSITKTNILNYSFNNYTINTCNELYSDEDYDPLRDKSWWDLHFKEIIKKIIELVIIIVLLLVMIFIPTSSCAVLTMFYEGTKAAISGMIIGGILGGIESYHSGDNVFKGITKGMEDGFIDGFIAGVVTSGFKQLLGFPNAFCFKEQTKVLTSEGLKNIEEIKEGEYVYSYNEETKEKELKKVVRLFRNKTNKWLHLKFKTKDTVEEIICTEEHPFFVPNKGYIKAKYLVENEEVLMYNNSCVVLVSKEVEELEKEEETYNFEVEDNHNYFVGESLILVHNRCKLGENMEHEGRSGKAWEDAHHIFPRKFRKDFSKYNIDIDKAEYGVWLEKGLHRAKAFKYNAAWKQVIDAYVVNENNAMEFARKFMKDIYNIII